jgi:hypothetical protein
MVFYTEETRFYARNNCKAKIQKSERGAEQKSTGMLDLKPAGGFPCPRHNIKDRFSVPSEANKSTGMLDLKPAGGFCGK